MENGTVSVHVEMLEESSRPPTARQPAHRRSEVRLFVWRAWPILGRSAGLAVRMTVSDGPSESR